MLWRTGQCGSWGECHNQYRVAQQGGRGGWCVARLGKVGVCQEQCQAEVRFWHLRRRKGEVEERGVGGWVPKVVPHTITAASSSFSSSSPSLSDFLHHFPLSLPHLSLFSFLSFFVIVSVLFSTCSFPSISLSFTFLLFLLSSVDLLPSSTSLTPPQPLLPSPPLHTQLFPLPFPPHQPSSSSPLYHHLCPLPSHPSPAPLHVDLLLAQALHRGAIWSTRWLVGRLPLAC